MNSDTMERRATSEEDDGVKRTNGDAQISKLYVECIHITCVDM